MRDFIAMWHFDKDPRFEPIHGEGGVEARMHYDARRASGSLRRRLAARRRRHSAMQTLELFEEHYDSGEVDFDFRWTDRDASYSGCELDVPSITLQEGQRHDARLAQRPARRRGARAHRRHGACRCRKIDAFGTLGLDRRRQA